MPITTKDLAREFRVGEKWVREIARQEIGGHRPHSPWEWPDGDPGLLRVKDRLAKGRATAEVREWEVTVSRKNQITVPAAALRKLGVRPGHRLRLLLKEASLELIPSPASWADHYAGAAAGLYGKGDKAVEAYLRESRGDYEPLG